jgi:hypothetical protein
VTVAAARESSSAHTQNGCAAADAGERKPYTEQRRFGEVWISYPYPIGSTTGSESRGLLYITVFGDLTGTFWPCVPAVESLLVDRPHRES